MLFCDNCKRDKQSSEPNKGVFPIGSVSPTYYILGDVVAPLEETDSIFTEQLPQYKFLMNTLVSAGLDLNSLRFFKLTRCGNILDEELEECRECCSNYCKVDIAKTNPDLIITLGAEPTKALIGSKFKSISSSRGRLYDIELYGKQFKVLPTYSPNYVVNAPDSGGLFLNDILKAKAYMDGELVDIKSKNLEYATTYEEFKAYHDKYLVNSQHPAYDLETNAHDPRSVQARMVGFSLAPDSSTGVYVVRNSLEYSMPEEDWDKVVELTKSYLSTRIPLVHNIMYEKPFTYNEWGYLIDEFDDTLVKARMLRGGDMGSASLKDQCILNLGYPDWDTDLSIYKRTFTTMLKKLKPSSAGKPKWEYNFIRDRGLCALLEEYNSMIASETSMSKNSKDLHENLEEMRDIILKYYISDTDYSCIMETIGDEICNLVDIQYDGPFSYGFIPMKVITKYGAMDAVGTQDLDVYLNSQMDKWSKELGIDMYRGYKYIRRQFVAGVDMELNGLYWNDEIASDCDKWYLEQSQNSLLNLINSPFLDNHLLSNSAHIINEELYKNHLDYVMEVLGPFKPMKSCIKLEDGTKLSYKVVLDAVNKKLGYNLQDKYKEESLELIRRIANKDKDIDRLKGFYNPGSTTQYARDLVNSILITPDIRVAHFMNRLHIMLDDPELDINTYPPSDRQLFQVLISCKEYNSKVDKYNEELDSDDRDDEILENLNHELGGDDSEEGSNEPRRRVKLSDRDTFDRFMQVLQNTQVQSSKMQNIIMESLSYNLTSVSEDNIIELHRYYLLLGVDLDNPDTWIDEFKFLFNFRMYKKCMKMRSTYIQGKRVGRGKVWVTSRKGLESGELLTKRTRLYTPDISEDEAYLMQASYNVCGAETLRWRTGIHTIPSGSDIKNIYTSRYKGGCIFAPDYSQMEIRCIAGASKCTPMLEAFKNGADIHMQNAVKIFRKPAEEILPAERRYSKMASFMILYGGDYKNFAEEYLDGDLKLGKYIYDSFYEAYPEIKTWIDERHEQMRTIGKVTTPMDYYINVSPEKYGGSESKALRAAQNYPIQSSGSAMAANVIYEILDYMKHHNLKSKIILFVHDSIEIDVHPDELLIMAVKVLRIMNDYPMSEFGIPTKADIVIGPSIGQELEMTEIETNEDYTEGTMKCEGFEDDFDQLMESWQSVYKVVEWEDIEPPKDHYVSYRELFIPKKAISRFYGMHRRKICRRLHIVIK